MKSVEGKSGDGGTAVAGEVVVTAGTAKLIGGACGVASAVASPGTDGKAFSGSTMNATVHYSDADDGTAYDKEWDGTTALNKQYLMLTAAHVHEFTSYEASGATLTATCGGAVGTCRLTDKKLTLTLTTDVAANAAAVKAWNEAGAAEATLSYYEATDTQCKNPLETPVKSGKYTAKVTADGKTAILKDIEYVSPYWYTDDKGEKVELETIPTIAEDKNDNVFWSGTVIVPAGKTVKIDGAVILNADTSIILSDGASLEITCGIEGEKTLTVYGQTLDTGTLKVTGPSGTDGSSGMIGRVAIYNNLVVNGGGVTVIGGSGGNGNTTNGGSGGDGITGNVTINGGTVTVTGGNGGNGQQNGQVGGKGVTGNVTINGGTATITGGNGGNGVTGNGSDGGKGVTGNITLDGGTATVTGGSGGSGTGGSGTNGAACGGTLDAEAQESDDNGNWTACSGSSTKRYLKLKTANVAEITRDGQVKKYKTLAEAVADAKDGETIKLTSDAKGDGIVIPENTFKTNGLTIDFDNHTYTVDGELVGSAGTQTNGFQFLKGNKITLKNGKIDVGSNVKGIYSGVEVTECRILIQNYSDLTLDGIELDGTKLEDSRENRGTYTLSNCCGDTEIKGDTVISASTEETDDSFAFDTDEKTGYTKPKVTVNGEDVVISGNVELSGGDLTLTAGTLNGTLVGEKGNGTVTKAAGFTSEAPEGYGWDKDGKLIVAAATIDGVAYATLEDAVAAAGEGKTLVIENDITLTKELDIAKKITIDLNGKTIKAGDSFTQATGAVIGVKHGGDLTIADSSNPSTGKIDANGKTYAAVIMAPAGDTADTNAAKLTVNGGTLSGDYYGIVGNGSAGRGNTEIAVAGGKIEGTHANDSLGIYNPQENSKVTVTGGEITGYSTGIEMRAGALTVSGGKISSTATSYSATANANGNTIVGAAVALSQHNTNKPLSATITGGELTGQKAFVEIDLQDDTVTDISTEITGGTFTGAVESENLTSFVKGGTFKSGLDSKYVYSDKFSDYEINGDGVVSKPADVAQIGENKYTSLDKALADAQNGDTITLLANVTTKGITVPTGVTLDLNGKTVTPTADGFTGISNKGTVKVYNANASQLGYLLYDAVNEIGGKCVAGEDITYNNSKIPVNAEVTAKKATDGKQTLEFKLPNGTQLLWGENVGAGTTISVDGELLVNNAITVKGKLSCDTLTNPTNKTVTVDGGEILVKAIDTAVSAAKTAIETEAGENPSDDVKTIVNAALEAIGKMADPTTITNTNTVAAINTAIEGLTKEARFDIYKQQTKEALNETYKNASDAVKAIISGDTTISGVTFDNTKTIAELKSSVDAAKTAVITKIELQQAKEDAADAINTAAGDTASRSEKMKTLVESYLGANGTVTKATTKANIESILPAAIAAVELRSAQDKAIADLTESVGNPIPADLQGKYDSYVTQIEAAASVSAVVSILETAVEEIGLGLDKKNAKDAIDAALGANPADNMMTIAESYKAQIDAATDRTAIANLKTTAVSAIESQIRKNSAVNELWQAAGNDNCDDVKSIIALAEARINAAEDEMEILIIKASTLETIAAHLPLHAASDVISGKTDSIIDFVESIFRASSADRRSGLSIFELILRIIRSILQPILSIFGR